MTLGSRFFHEQPFCDILMLQRASAGNKCTTVSVLFPHSLLRDSIVLWITACVQVESSLGHRAWYLVIRGLEIQ